MRLVLAPTVVSFDRTTANPTTASGVSYKVVFSESVNGVDTSEFAVVKTGAVGTTTIFSPSSKDGGNNDTTWFVSVSFDPTSPVTSPVTLPARCIPRSLNPRRLLLLS